MSGPPNEQSDDIPSTETVLCAGYEAMASDQLREAEALEWIEGTLEDFGE